MQTHARSSAADRAFQKQHGRNRILQEIGNLLLIETTAITALITTLIRGAKAAYILDLVPARDNRTVDFG
jgi:hypothetical protein